MRRRPLSAQAGRPFELGDARVERAVLLGHGQSGRDDIPECRKTGSQRQSRSGELAARSTLPQALGELTTLMRETVGSLYAFMLQIDQRIRAFDKEIDAIFKGSEACQRIARISGVSGRRLPPQ
jgi:hypothetical protein